MRQVRDKLTYANVVATLALFIAIGGASAFAATQLGKNSVGTKQLKKNSVTTAKLKSNSVNGAKVADGSLTGADIADGSLTGTEINQSSLTAVRASNVMALAFNADASCSPALPLPSGVSSKRLNPGVCEISFPHPVANCAFTSSLHTRNATLVVLAIKQIEEFDFSEAPNSLIVDTRAEGSLSNEPFDLVVVC